MKMNCGIEEAHDPDDRQVTDLQSGTVNLDELLVALEDIREGLNVEDFAEIERAMNEEYIEPLNTKNLRDE